jgi:hypothetical protein
MGYYVLSKNYKETAGAGNKAKTDIENILCRLGYKQAGLPQTHYKNAAVGFMITLLGMLKVIFTVSRGDRVVVQYPLKKYYPFVCNIIHAKGGKVITIVHDLGSFRRKKLTVRKEIKRLNHADYLVVHNEHMKAWLTGKGYAKEMVCLGIFDYLSATKARDRRPDSLVYRVLYGGGLNGKKNSFLYSLDNLAHNWRFVLYGKGFEKTQISERTHFEYRGFVPSDRLIAEADGDFCLVWEGESTTTCSGAFGEYLKYNNPHKVSLYIRCNLPVIIWKEAALASFVIENKIGVCIDSLEELDKILPSISKEEYRQMKLNTKQISQKLSEGYYITKALDGIHFQQQ